MRVKLLYFGVLRDLFGVAVERIETADTITVRELLVLLREILQQRTSKKAMIGVSGERVDERLWGSLAVAVNREYSGLDAVLSDGDEVALLPPVSGGCGQGLDRRNAD
ncbi:MAG TPA: MoaD/ThiS family protein [Acidobacteriaceae bacterium]|nr:MoaD/ThiS family protein [Acidobacteriaceae bacterium]